MKDCDKNKESLYLNYCDINNLYGWVMSQKLSEGDFKWVENTSQISKNFIKNCCEDGDEGYSLGVDLQYPKELHDLHNYLSFLPTKMKIGKVDKK